jgi:hypothetical protein
MGTWISNGCAPRHVEALAREPYEAVLAASPNTTEYMAASSDSP